MAVFFGYAQRGRGVLPICKTCVEPRVVSMNPPHPPVGLSCRPHRARPLRDLQEGGVRSDTDDEASAARTDPPAGLCFPLSLLIATGRPRVWVLEFASSRFGGGSRARGLGRASGGPRCAPGMSPCMGDPRAIKRRHDYALWCMVPAGRIPPACLCVVRCGALSFLTGLRRGWAGGPAWGEDHPRPALSSRRASDFGPRRAGGLGPPLLVYLCAMHRSSHCSPPWMNAWALHTYEHPGQSHRTVCRRRRASSCAPVLRGKSL